MAEIQPFSQTCAKHLANRERARNTRSMPKNTTSVATRNADPAEQPARIKNIIELAKLAGVSPGTVSRALTGKGTLSEKTRAKVVELARQHGFRLNQMASRLRTQRTGVVGVVFPLGHARHQHISDPFFMTMLGALADQLTESGYDLMLSRVVPGDGEWLDRIVDSGMLDGTIVIGQSDQVDTIDRVARRYVPMVVWGKSGFGHCTVGTDNAAGGQLAVEHLIAGGRRKLAFLGDVRGPEIADRLLGARRAAEAAAGVTLEAAEISLSQDDMHEQIAAFVAERGRHIDGIFAATDLIATNTMRALREAGLRVPDDVAVVGYDDLPLAAQADPPLTTISQNVVQGAQALVQALLPRIDGTETPSVVIAPELVVRGST